EITPMVEPLLASLDAEDGDLRVRRGNVMARQRMIVLYDRSVAFDALVAGTSNKTEVLLGYTTLYGDQACALAPIRHRYKSQLPPVAKLSLRTPGIDHLYPRRRPGSRRAS